MYADQNNPALKKYRALRQREQRRAQIREGILAKNPQIDPDMLARLVHSQLQKEEQRQRPKRKPNKSRPKQPRQEHVSNDALRQQLMSVYFK